MHWKVGNKILIVFNSIVQLLKKHINSSYEDAEVSTVHIKYIQGCTEYEDLTYADYYQYKDTVNRLIV